MAATNVAFPLVTISTALALLFGVGGASNFFTSIGKANLGFWMSLTRQILLLTPLLLILPIFYGIDGVMWAGPPSDSIAAVLAIIFAVREIKKMKDLELQEQVVAGQPGGETPCGKI